MEEEDEILKQLNSQQQAEEDDDPILAQLNSQGGGGAATNFTDGSSEPQEQSTTTTSEEPSKPSTEGGRGVAEAGVVGAAVGAERPEPFSFKLPKISTEDKSASEVKAEQAQQELEATGEDMRLQRANFPEIATRKVTEEERPDYIKEATDSVSVYKDRLKEIEDTFKEIERDPNTIPQGVDRAQYIQQLAEAYNNTKGDILSTTAAIAAEKSKDGSTIGALRNSLVDGYTRALEGTTEIVFSVMAAINPEMAGADNREQALVNARQAAKDMGTKEVLNTILKDPETTQEYVDRLKRKSIFHEGALGAVESIYGMATPMMTGLGAQVYNATLEELDTVEGLTEAEKATYGALVSTVNLALERVGLSKVIKGTPAVTSKIASKVLNKAIKEAPDKTADAIEAAIARELTAFERGLATGGQRFANSFLAEAETGGLQELSEIGLQEVTNAYKGQEIFQTPDNLDQYINQVSRAAAAEGVGGLLFGAIPSVAAAVREGRNNPLGNLTDEQFKDLERRLKDPVFTDALKDNIQAQIDAGMTQQEAEQTLAAISEVKDVINSLPPNTPNKAMVADLLMEKGRLEKAKENAPDPMLYDDLISDVKKQIKDLTTPQENVQQQETTQTQEGGVRNRQEQEAQVEQTQEETTSEEVTPTEQQSDEDVVVDGSEAVSGLEEQTQQEEDAIQERETEEVPVGEEAQVSEEVVGEVREQTEATQEAREEEVKTPKKPKTKIQKQIDKSVEGKIGLEPKFTISEKAGLKKQIRDFAKGMREAATDQRKTAKAAQEILRELKAKGKVNTRQVKALAKAATNLNFASPKSVFEFANRVEKTIVDAEYNEKLDKAKSVRGKLKVRPNTFASDKARVKEFKKLDPSKAESIEEYTEIAEKIRNAIKSPRRTAKDVTLQTTMNYEEVDAYIKKEQANQEKITEQYLKDEYDYLEDLDLTVEELNSIISLLEEGKEPNLTEERKAKVDEALNTLSQFYKAPLKEKLKEEGITPRQQEVINTLIDGDISELYFNQKARVIRLMENILENNAYSDAINITNELEVKDAVKKLQERGIRGIDPRILYTKAPASLYSTEIMTLTESLRNLFRGQSTSDFFSLQAGITDLDMGVVAARLAAREVIGRYNNMVADMVGHSTKENIAKRRVYSFLTRNDGKTPTQIKQEFDRRKAIIKEQLEYFKRTDNEMTDVLEQVLNDLNVEEAQTPKDLKIDSQNRKIVDFFVDEFEKLYDKHSEVAEMVFNKILPQDGRYLPDVFSPIDPNVADVDLNESSYFNDAIDTKESSMLTDVTKPKGLPKNQRGNVTRILNLDFDDTMIRKLEEGLLETEIAPTTDKLSKFINRDNLGELMEDDAATVLRTKIISYVNGERGKQKPVPKAVKKVNRAIDWVANTIAIKLLASVFQPIKQTLPVMFRAGINMRPQAVSAMFQAYFNKDPRLNQLADKYGTVALRGQQSSVDVDKLKDKLTTSGQFSEGLARKLGIERTVKAQRLLRSMKEAYDKPLEYTLERPDVKIAKASWAGYYLDKLGEIKPDFNIDEELQNPTKEAVQYANSMVAQTQNESQGSKMGDIFQNRSVLGKIVRNVLFPFANFLQALRSNIYNNFIIATSKSASKEDKKTAARNLVSASVEIASFNVVSVGVRALNIALIGSILNVLGVDTEDEEEDREIEPVLGIPMTQKEKRVFYTNVIGDLSPLPVADNAMLYTVERINKAMKEAKGEEYDKFKDNIVYAPMGMADAILSDGGKFGSAYDLVMDTEQLMDMADVFTDDDKFSKNTIFGTAEYPVPVMRESDINLALAIHSLYLLAPIPKDIEAATKEIVREVEQEAKELKERQRRNKDAGLQSSGSIQSDGGDLQTTGSIQE